MDPKYGGEAAVALGQTSNTSSLSFPGSNSGSNSGSNGRSDDSVTSLGFPKVDDHLVQPEVSREEIIRGRKIVTMGANPEHAEAHSRLDFVIAPHVVEDCATGSDLLTRVNQGSNFATDVSVRKKGVDPVTGVRYLEELSFEVVNEQSARDAREKAEDLVRRGVRRVFGIFVKKGYVAEWSREKGAWNTLPTSDELTDRLFVRPISITALLNAAAAEMEVAKVLWQKQNPVLKEINAQTYKEGHKEGRLDAQRDVLQDLVEVKFGPSKPDVIEAIRQASTAQLRLWTKAVLGANTLDEMFAATQMKND